MYAVSEGTSIFSGEQLVVVHAGVIRRVVAPDFTTGLGVQGVGEDPLRRPDASG